MNIWLVDYLHLEDGKPLRSVDVYTWKMESILHSGWECLNIYLIWEKVSYLLKNNTHMHICMYIYIISLTIAGRIVALVLDKAKKYFS